MIVVRMIMMTIHGHNTVMAVALSRICDIYVDNNDDDDAAGSGDNGDDGYDSCGLGCDSECQWW